MRAAMGPSLGPKPVFARFGVRYREADDVFTTLVSELHSTLTPTTIMGFTILAVGLFAAAEDRPDHPQLEQLSARGCHRRVDGKGWDKRAKKGVAFMVWAGSIGGVGFSPKTAGCAHLGGGPEC